MYKKELFFRLLKAGLVTESIGDEQSVIDEVFSTADYQLSIQHGIAAFIFDGLQKTTDVGVVPMNAASREIKMKLFSHTMQVEKQCKVQYAKAVELADIYAEHGIRAVVLKGIAAGQCYPNPWHRPCGDLDCYLIGRSYKESNRIVANLGINVDDSYYKNSEFDFKGLFVENHQYCTTIRGSKRAKRFERLLHNLLKSEGTTRINGTNLEEPSPMFNALYLTNHSLRHFLSEVISLRHLCDWAMLLQKHGNDIDWSIFCGYADEYGLRKFADTMTQLSVDYLGISVPIGYDTNVDRERKDFLMHEILYGNPHNIKGTKWQLRKNTLMNITKNARRFKMFSDVSYFGHLVALSCGFFFDRNPKL